MVQMYLVLNQNMHWKTLTSVHCESIVQYALLAALTRKIKLDTS